jgi:branched-chain amino acid transport system permease protein
VPDDVLLRATGVCKIFGTVRALDCVDLHVRAGEILGLVGPNGSGKSTFINVLSRYFKADGGEIHFGGTRIDRLPAHRVAGLGLARTYQVPRPFATLTSLENVTAGELFGRAGGKRDSRDRARELLDFVGLAGQERTVSASLTLHQRKQLELARALACRPRLIMLDEVLAGLNPTEIESAILLVRRIRDLGISVIFVEHNMRAVASLSDRVVVVQSGRLIAEGAPDDVLRRPDVVEAYLGSHGSQHA